MEISDLKNNTPNDVLKKINNIETKYSLEYQVYDEYMSNIILQLPNADKLKLLKGTSNSQASFYFVNERGEVNATLYNNQLNQRIIGKGTQYGLDQVEVEQDSFTNSYLSVYTKLRYQLSPTDEEKQQKININVDSTIKKLIPLWNTWVECNKPLKVSKLNETNTYMALIQMTDTLNTIWLNLSFKAIIQEDPSYPYNHIDEFTIIYNKIPESVYTEMIELMINIYRLSGDLGAITAKVANATHTLAGIIYNIQQPSKENKGLAVTGSDKLIPGISFDPSEPIHIIDQLKASPVTSYTNRNMVFKISEELLRIDTESFEGIKIAPLKFLSHIDKNGKKSSIFQKSFAGSSYEVKAFVNNPVIHPQVAFNPILFDSITNEGWMLSDPVKNAIKNGYPPPTDVTDYVFNSPPDFNFDEGGDFGYINAIIFSQFLELYINFTSCDTKKVKEYFKINAKSKLSFLENKPSNYMFKFSEETENSIMVMIKPEPPGFIPPEIGNIEHSLCQLVAVEVIYPFS